MWASGSQNGDIPFVIAEVERIAEARSKVSNGSARPSHIALISSFTMVMSVIYDSRVIHSEYSRAMNPLTQWLDLYNTYAV